MTEKDSVIIFTAKKARQLLKEGYQCVDIKPDKMDETHQRSLFVFQRSEDLMNRLKEMKNEEKLV